MNQLSRAECRPKSRRITEFLNKQEQKRQRERETDRKRERERERLWKRLTGADPHDLINRTFAHHHRGFLVHFFSFFLDFFFCAFGKNNWPAYRGLGGEPRHSKRKTASFLSLSLSLSLSLWSVKRRTVVEVCRKICLLTTCFGGRSLSPPPVYQLSNRLVFDAYQANGIVNVSKQHLPFGRLSRWFNVIYGARWSPPAARYRRRPLEECEFLFFFLVVVEMLSLFLFVSPRQRSVSFRNFEPPIRSNEKETMKVSRSVNRFKRLFKRDRERKHQKKRQLWNELNGTHLHCCVIDWERKTARVSPDRCQELGCLEKKKSSRKNVHRVPRTADRWRCAAISIDTSSSKPFHNKSMR